MPTPSPRSLPSRLFEVAATRGNIRDATHPSPKCDAERKALLRPSAPRGDGTCAASEPRLCPSTVPPAPGCSPASPPPPVPADRARARIAPRTSAAPARIRPQHLCVARPIQLALGHAPLNHLLAERPPHDAHVVIHADLPPCRDVAFGLQHDIRAASPAARRALASVLEIGVGDPIRRVVREPRQVAAPGKWDAHRSPSGTPLVLHAPRRHEVLAQAHVRLSFCE